MRRPSSKRFPKPQKFIDDRLLRFRDQQSRPSRRSAEKDNTLGRGFFLGESHAPLIHCGSNRQLPGLRRRSPWKGLFSAERLVCGLPHQGLPRRCSRDAQSAGSGVQGRPQPARSRAACPSFEHATSRPHGGSDTDRGRRWPPDIECRRPSRRLCGGRLAHAGLPARRTSGSCAGVVSRSTRRLPFRLEVVSASVPTERSLKVTNWFSLDDKTSRQFYGVAAFSPEWWKLVSSVAGVLAAHRQNVILTPLLTLIQPKVEGGQLAYDFTNFDRWVETFEQAGAIGYIEGSHLLDRAGSYDAPLLVPTFQIIDGKPQAVSLPPDDQRAEAFLSGFLTLLGAHLRDRVWEKLYLQHVLDEAHGNEIPYYGRFAALVHRLMPGIPTIDAVDAAQMPEVLQNNCDVWV